MFLPVTAKFYLVQQPHLAIKADFPPEKSCTDEPLVVICHQKLKMMATTPDDTKETGMDAQMTHINKKYGASIYIELWVAKQQKHMNCLETEDPIFMQMPSATAG